MPLTGFFYLDRVTCGRVGYYSAGSASNRIVELHCQRQLCISQSMFECPFLVKNAPF